MTPEEHHSADDSPRRLAAFIRVHQHDILSEWEHAARKLPQAQQLDRPALIDHIPDLLEHIAQMAEDLGDGTVLPSLSKEAAERHAIERLEEGFDLRQVVAEFALLRDCIIRQWERVQLPERQLTDLVLLNRALDKAVSESVGRYTQARDRALQGLDRIANAALDSKSLDDLLRRLLQVLIETTPAADTAAILLREGDRLRLRASVGLEEDVAAGFSVALGEGFAGSIATEGRPKLLQGAATHPLVTSAALKARAVKSLYGMPLLGEGGEVVGVAHVGSVTAPQFSEQDKKLFATMASRATAAIHQHLLRENTLTRARQQEAVARLGVFALEQTELQPVMERAVEVAADTLGVELAKILELQPTGRTLVLRAGVGWRPGLVGRATVDAGTRSHAGFTLTTEEPVVVHDLRTESRFSGRALLHDHGVCSGVSVVIHGPGRDGTPYGVFGAHSRTPRSFTPDDVNFLQSIANVVAAAVARSTAEQQAAQARDATARAEQQRRLDAQHALASIDALFSSSLAGLGFLDRDLRFIRVNEALAVMNGASAEAHLGRTVREVLATHDPAAIDGLERVLRGVLATGKPLLNIEVTTAVSPTRSFLANYFPVRTPDGETLGIGAAVVEITGRKRAEEALRERELRFRALADNMPQLAWMADAKGDIDWYNRRWFEFTGTTLEQMQGGGWTKVHHPGHRDRVVEKFRRHLESGELWEDTFPLRGRDGRYRWFLSRALPITGDQGEVVRWFGTNTDVTEQRFLAEATRRLGESLEPQTTLRTLAELTAPDLGDCGFVDVVERGGLRRAAATCTAPQPDEAMVREAVSTGEPVQRGNALSVPLRARDQVIAVFTCMFTAAEHEHTAAERELAVELARRAAYAVDNATLFREAQNAVRAREEVLAVVSHDLRNPLSAVQMASALLIGRATVDPAARRHAETINRSATRMGHLINDLLDFASLQAGRLSMEKGSQDADALVTEAVDAHEPAATAKGLTIERFYAVRDLHLWGDRERVLQVFGNLLGNAIKFCSRGDVITVRCEREGEAAHFSIADTGPGIPLENLPRIFEPYWSAKEHAKKGTGLGLYISQGIVTAHGGRLWVESEPGRGTTFHFTIPLESSEAKAAPLSKGPDAR